MQRLDRAFRALAQFRRPIPPRSGEGDRVAVEGAALPQPAFPLSVCNDRLAFDQNGRAPCA